MAITPNYTESSLVSDSGTYGRPIDDLCEQYPESLPASVELAIARLQVRHRNYYFTKPITIIYFLSRISRVNYFCIVFGGSINLIVCLVLRTSFYRIIACVGLVPTIIQGGPKTVPSFIFAITSVNVHRF